MKCPVRINPRTLVKVRRVTLKSGTIAAKTVVYSIVPSTVFDAAVHHTALSLSSVTDCVAINVLGEVVKFLIKI